MSGKYALIIGNSEYTDPGLAQLVAPGKDAEDFASVLQAPDLCAFDHVNVLLNRLSSTAMEAIDEFFDQRKPDDLLVLYFSGHGVRDEVGSLYLTFKNTIRSRLRATAIKSDYIREAMDQSRSKRQVLVLDCCNSGAFPQGAKAEVGGAMGLATAFQGYGRYILTASDATQFAWEGDQIIGQTENSLFTHFLVKGLKGEADKDGDGKITVDELYDYAFEQISKVTPKQTPTKSSSKAEGEIILRQITRIEDIKPVPLPEDLENEIEDLRPYVREAAVLKLEKILKGKNIGIARSAMTALEKIASDENTTRRVAQLAIQALESYHQVERKAEEERRAREEAERLAALKAEEERLVREKVEAERKAREEAEKLQRAQAEREAAEREAARLKAEREAAETAAREAAIKAEREKAEKEIAERVAAQTAEREARELASRKKAEREAAEKAERKAMKLAAQKKAEREAKEKGKADQAVKPAWSKYSLIAGIIVAFILCGYAIVKFFPSIFPLAAAPDCARADIFCVGLVTDVGKVNDKSFNQAAWDGIQQAKAEGIANRVQYIETSDSRDYDKNISAFADAGFDVIVTWGYNMTNATYNAARKYPGILFIGGDQALTRDDAHPDWPLANLVAVVYHEDQSGFLVGALAAMMSRSHRIGAVCGTDAAPAVWRYGEGYRAGAAYEDARNNIRTEVTVVYHSDAGFDLTFTDPTWGANTATALINQGADVLFGCGGETGNGAIKAASQRGVYVIGVDTDQYFTLPEAAGRLLSSALKMETQPVSNIIRLAREGNFPKMGLFIGDSGYAPYHDLASAVPSNVDVEMQALLAGLRNGSIVTNVPAQKP